MTNTALHPKLKDLNLIAILFAMIFSQEILASQIASSVSNDYLRKCDATQYFSWYI